MKEDSRLRILLLCICLAATLATAGWLASQPETASDIPRASGHPPEVSAGTASLGESAFAPFPESPSPVNSLTGFQPALPEYRPGALSRPDFSAAFSREIPAPLSSTGSGRASSPRESSSLSYSRPNRPAPPSLPDTPSTAPSSLPSSRQESSAAPSAPSEEEPPSATPSEPSAPPVSSEDIHELRRENDSRAASLQNRTGVVVLLLRAWGSDWDSLIHSPGGSEAALSSALDILENALFPYENGTLLELGITVCITGALSSGEAFYSEARLLILSCQGDFSSAARSFLFETVWDTLPAGISGGLAHLVPEDFFYGIPDPFYVYSHRNLLSGWFLSLEAQESPDADFRSLLRAFLESPSFLWQIPKTAPLRERGRLFLQEFAGAYPVVLNDPNVRDFLDNG